MVTVTQAYRFALDPSPAQVRALASHVGAARFCFNWGLSLVKSRLDETAGGADLVVPWSLPALRREWNQAKTEVAPWWAENSKEAYSSGLDALARALANFSDGRAGRRRGRPAGFPRFKKRDRGGESVRFTTGAIRVEADRHHVTLPRLGAIRTHESTRKLARRLESGQARILSATVRRVAGRWFCSFTVEVHRAERRPAHIGAGAARVGIDVGITRLAVVATPQGEMVAEVTNPRALRRAQVRLRRAGRRLARSQPGSKRRSRRRSRLVHLHSRVNNVRRDSLAKLTTTLACRHDIIVVEHLHAEAMRRRGGAYKRGLNRSLADASLAEIRRLLTYKCLWYGSTLVEAEPFYLSSKTCSACGTVRTTLRLDERHWVCDTCNTRHDRDVNAAINLARLSAGHGTGSGPGTGRFQPANGRGHNHKTRRRRAGVEEPSTPQPSRHQTGTANPQGTAA